MTRKATGIRWGPASLVGILLIAATMLLGASPVLGDLQWIESHREGEAGVEGLDHVRGVAVSADGAHVYTISQEGNAVTLFRRDGATGRLTFVKAYVNGEGGIDGLAGGTWLNLSPDGAHLYASGLTEGTVAVFARDAATGELTWVEVQRDGENGVDGIAGAREVSISPDGANVYVAGIVEHSVAVFSRDSSTGALTFVEMEKEGIDGVEGLTAVRGVLVSPDGAHAYAGGFQDNAVVLFSRNPLTGELTFVEAKREGQDGITGLIGVAQVALSLDGRHLYALGWMTGTVVVFERDAATGALTYLDTQSNGENGITKMGVPAGIAVSPDGAAVYVTAETGGAVVVLARDTASGLLSCISEQTAGLGLEPAAVALSPDSAHAYVAVQGEDALSVFAVMPHICCGDANWDNEVTIDELIRAVNNAMAGCPYSMEQ